MNNYIGFISKPDKEPLYDIIYPHGFGYVVVLIRTILGMMVLLATREICKPILKNILFRLFNQDKSNPDSFKKKRIELPLNYLTYFILGVNVTFTSPYIYRCLNIERDLRYTELWINKISNE